MVIASYTVSRSVRMRVYSSSPEMIALRARMCREAKEIQRKGESPAVSHIERQRIKLTNELSYSLRWNRCDIIARRALACRSIRLIRMGM